jgi:hypothetical protein
MPLTIQPDKPGQDGAKAPLRHKLAAIRREIHNIGKRGRNEFHKYDYAQASDVAGQIGTALAEHNIIIARRNLEVFRNSHMVRRRDGDSEESIVEVKVEYGFLDADSNEELWQPAWGEGRDSGDKAVYKAFTGAFKYLLIQAFCLATGDDPEADDTKTAASKTAVERYYAVHPGGKEAEIENRQQPEVPRMRGLLSDDPAMLARFKNHLTFNLGLTGTKAAKEYAQKRGYDWPAGTIPDDLPWKDREAIAKAFGMEMNYES